MADPYTPFGYAMPRLMRPAGAPADMPPTLTGAENFRVPAATPPPFGLQQLIAAGMGALNPFGLTPPPLTVMQSAGQTLTGEPLPEQPRTVSFDTGDPQSEAVGSLVGMSPAFSMAGQAARGIGNLAARAPRATAATAATAGLTVPAATQEPTPNLRAPKARGAVAAVQKRQAELDDLIKTTTQDAKRFDGLDWNNPAKVKEAQEFLIGRGINVGPTGADGRPGTDTRAAVTNYARETKQALERLRTQQSQLSNELAEANKAVTEAERLDQLAEGSRRLKEVGEPGMLESYGPLLGYPLGFALGYKGRMKLGNFVGKRAEARAARADALGADFGQGSVTDRAGRINQYWTEGGGSPAPFAFRPNARPFPWESVTRESQMRRGRLTTRDVPTADQLYRPGLAANLGPGATTLGAGALEAGSGAYFGADAHRELQEAQAAVSGAGPGQGPTEANIQRLLAARRNAALWETLSNVGRGTMAGGVVGEAKSRLMQGPGARPNVGRAEAERGEIDLLLNPPPPPPPPPPAGPPPAQPRWDPSVGRWRLNGGFVRAPRP